MSKNIALTFVIILLLVVCFIAFFKNDAPVSDMITTNYSNGTSTIEAVFDTSKKTVTFTQDDIGTITLPQAVSGSGARYATADESIVFWEHQQEVTITKNGVEVFKGILK